MTERLEVIARMTIRPGQLEGFKAQAAELIRLTQEKDTQTLRYDWFINEREMVCEVHEDYASEAGFFEHNRHVMDARAVLFARYADGHQMSFFGEVSPQLVALTEHHAEGAHVFHFSGGLSGPRPPGANRAPLSTSAGPGRPAH